MRFITVLATLALSLPATAANIYIVSSGDAPTDNAVIAALTSRGHTCTLGPQHTGFDGSQSLAGFQTVYLQDNANYDQGAMPVAGQQALIAWVQSGGRLVTSEWTTYFSAPGYYFALLGPAFPLVQSYAYGAAATGTYDQSFAASLINDGVPASLTFPLTNYSGTEVYANAKPGATTYYTTRGHAGSVGLAGWTRGAGSVFSFSTTCGPAQLGDPNFGRLFSNVMAATAVSSCYPNCDGSASVPVLNIADFICFQSLFAAGDPLANCDGSTTPPILNVSDFICFQSAFAAGCP